MGRNPFSLFWSHLFDRLPQRRQLDRQDRPCRRRALIFSLLTVALGFAYLLWLLPLVFRDRIIPSFLFLGVEILSFLLLALMAFDVWHLRGPRPEGLVPARQWRVDLPVPSWFGNETWIIWHND